MWKGSGRSLFQSLILENSKFLLFVATPIITAAIFCQEEWIEYIVRSRKYVTYPPEAEKPPTNVEELRKMQQRYREKDR